ncbi:MAG TPA: ABC transporter permease, partial [Candidatus Saccharimonadia bacterium]|nr:ABC transporter permease [Candidatus Saccharimonadia bacterium]
MSANRLHFVMFRSLWAYRGFVVGAVQRELEGKYRGSLLGALWVVLSPLAQILVFTLVFAEIMKPVLPGHAGSVFAYSIYLCGGVLPWTLFAEGLGRLNTVFIDNANLIKKASFPRIALPTVVLGTAVVNFAVITGLFLVFLENANLIKKASFPRIALPAVVVVSALLNFAVIMGLFFAFLSINGS